MQFCLQLVRAPRDENMFTGCCRTLPCEFVQSSTVVANTGRPVGFRHGAALAGLFTWCVVMMVPFATLRAQTPFYFAGISSSWGEKSGIVCTLTCGKGSASSHKNLTAPTAGVTITLRTIGPLQLETGGFLAPKGWAVTTPTLRVVYLEIPLLAHLGFWPQGAGFGAGITGGLAADLDILNPGHSDAALVAGIRFQAATSRGKRYSLSMRFAKGFNTIYGLQNHVITLLLGFSPARKGAP